MEQMTISQASDQFGISTRTLRYWEQVGLIESERQQDYAYRVYTGETVQRIAQILILRRLRIPLSEIGDVLRDPNAQKLLEVLRVNIERIDSETDALSTVRRALTTLANYIALSLETKVLAPTDRDALLTLLSKAAPLPETNKEELKMSDLKNAEMTLSARMDVRYVYLPPMTVAASQYTGPNPEDNAGAVLDRFVLDSGLLEKMPGLRVFGFNNPNPESPNAMYGYEYWVTIPEDMDVPAPLVKKQFEGGLYAAHVIKIGDFHEWEAFTERMQQDENYAIHWREPYSMGGCLEEHLNAPGYYRSGCTENFRQIDLLIPIA